MSKRAKRDEVEAKINEKAAKDKEFKKKLLHNPHKALEEMGMHIPSSVKIHVRVEEAGSWELVVRSSQANTSNISEEELKRMTGGVNDLTRDDNRSCNQAPDAC